MSIRNGISGVTSILIWSLALLLLIALAAAHLNPSIISVSGLFTLLTPILILANLIALIYALIRAKNAGWVTFILLLLSIPQIGNLWGFNVFSSNEGQDPTFKLMTYNVRNFDLYNWSENDHSREQIFEMQKTGELNI